MEPESGHRAGTSGHRKWTGSGVLAVTNEERAAFQCLLGKLEASQHLELFHQFESTAQWKQFPHGDVELDDRNTRPHVFRQMVGWCREKVGLPPLPTTAPPAPKKRRVTASQGSNWNAPGGIPPSSSVMGCDHVPLPPAQKTVTSATAEEDGSNLLQHKSDSSLSSDSSDGSSSATSSSSGNVLG